MFFFGGGDLEVSLFRPIIYYIYVEERRSLTVAFCEEI
jgi:hypothetical protein